MFDSFGVVWESTVENISNHPEWSLRAIFRELEYSNFFRIVWKKSVFICNSFFCNANFFPKIALNKSFKSLRIRRFDRVYRMIFSVNGLQKFFQPFAHHVSNTFMA